MPRGVATGAWGHVPPPPHKNHPYIFFYLLISRVNILRPHKNHAYVMFKYAYLTVFMPLLKVIPPTPSPGGGGGGALSSQLDGGAVENLTLSQTARRTKNTPCHNIPY